MFFFGVIFFLNGLQRKVGKPSTEMLSKMFLFLLGFPSSIIREHAWKAHSLKTGQAACGRHVFNSRSASLI